MTPDISLQTSDAKSIAEVLANLSKAVNEGPCQRLMGVVMRGNAQATFFDSGGGDGDAATIGTLMILATQLANSGWSDE